MADTGDLPLESGICLALVRHGDDHGYAIARHFEPGRPIGDVYSLTRPAVYRCLAALEHDRFVAVSPDKGVRGQVKKRLRLTARGADATREWLSTPVRHLRDMRLDFLAKVVLRDMLGLEPGPLVRAQRAEFAGLFAGLAAESQRTAVALWRREQVVAVSRFLDQLEGLSHASATAATDTDGPETTTGEMILSARNQLRGTVRSVVHGGILSSVKVDIEPGQVLTSTITREATEHLGLAPGSEVTAVFKATDVMVAAPAPGTRGRKRAQPPR